MQQMQKTLRLLAGIFTLVAILLIVAGLIVYGTDAAWKRDAVPVRAVVTDYIHSAGEDGRYLIAYEVDGVAYEGVLHYSDSAMRVGSKVDIFVKSDDPTQFRAGGATIATMVLLIVGATFLIPSAILWYIALRNSRREATLRASGTEIIADVMEVQPTAVRVNNRRTYIILCQWKNPQDDMTYIFRSPSLLYDPTAVLREREIATLPVLVDPYNYKKYLVDLSSVEEKVVVL